VACAVIAAARRNCGVLVPQVWPNELIYLTGLQHAHFSAIEEKLITMFESKFGSQHKQSSQKENLIPQIESQSTQLSSSTTTTTTTGTTAH
jgi:hypothetical protein